MNKLSHIELMNWLNKYRIFKAPYSEKIPPDVSVDMNSFRGIVPEMSNFLWDYAIFSLSDYFAASDEERKKFIEAVGGWNENLIFKRTELFELSTLVELVSKFPNGWSFYIYTEEMTFYFWDGEFVDIWQK